MNAGRAPAGRTGQAHPLQPPCIAIVRRMAVTSRTMETRMDNRGVDSRRRAPRPTAAIGHQADANLRGLSFEAATTDSRSDASLIRTTSRKPPRVAPMPRRRTLSSSLCSKSSWRAPREISPCPRPGSSCPWSSDRLATCDPALRYRLSDRRRNDRVRS
jgi:hypothetical protein